MHELNKAKVLKHSMEGRFTIGRRGDKESNNNHRRVGSPASASDRFDVVSCHVLRQTRPGVHVHTPWCLLMSCPHQYDRSARAG